MNGKILWRRVTIAPDPRRAGNRPSLRRSGMLSLLAAGAMLTGICAGAVPASAAARPATTHLANGETATHYASGATLYTAPMRLRPAGRVQPDGFGQHPGDCGVAKLWTYPSNHTYQLSLIGYAGVVLGNGWAETSTDGVTEIPSFVGISARGQTWTSGRVDIWPGLFPQLAATVGNDVTSIGDCLITVTAKWS
jgi:hypothetical protein